MEDVWKIFVSELNKVSLDGRFRIHAFVLMHNHYHLVASTAENVMLGNPMQSLQKSVSRTINFRADRINHVFGGPYKGCLITCPYHYARVLKYVYRNPVKAGICSRVEDYIYSTVLTGQSKIRLSKPFEGFDTAIPRSNVDYFKWLNKPAEIKENELITKILKKTHFKVAMRDAGIFRNQV